MHLLSHLLIDSRVLPYPLTSVVRGRLVGRIAEGGDDAERELDDRRARLRPRVLQHFLEIISLVN